MTLTKLAAAQAIDATAQTITAVALLAFMAGYSRSDFGALPFDRLCAFADAHRLPRMAALLAQVQLRDKTLPVDPRALEAVGALA